MTTTSYDQSCPETLKQTQLWFGSIIERPIDTQNRINPKAPSGRSIAEEAPDYICPSPTLRPHERIQIYNQQYWWRLLNILHENYPLLVRLFGYYSFNQIIGFPYLCDHRPSHWSLSFLGASLPKWLKRVYKGEDKPLIVNGARVDEAYNNVFFVKRMPPLEKRAAGSLLSCMLYLQPTVYLFAFPYDLLRFREAIIEKKDADYWLTNPFPALQKMRRYHYILYRSEDNHIHWQEVEPGQFHLLSRFQSGSTMNQVIDWLEAQTEDWTNSATRSLIPWIQGWTVEGWLTPKRPFKIRRCWPPL